LSATAGDSAYVDSWQLALHDKADSTRRLYGECLDNFARELPEGRSLLEVKRRDCQGYLAGLKAEGELRPRSDPAGSRSGRSTGGCSAA